MDTRFINHGAAAAIAYGLLSRRLASAPISGPAVFVGSACVSGALDLETGDDLHDPVDDEEHTGDHREDEH